MQRARAAVTSGRDTGLIQVQGCGQGGVDLGSRAGEGGSAVRALLSMDACLFFEFERFLCPDAAVSEVGRYRDLVVTSGYGGHGCGHGSLSLVIARSGASGVYFRPVFSK